MILIIGIAIGCFLLFVIVCFLNGIYLQVLKLEVGIKGFSLEFKAKEKSSHPNKK